MRVLLVCSTGGHLAQMARLQPWWVQHERMWVTFDKPDARAILADERVVWAHHPTTRNIPNLVRNSALAYRVMRSFRPDAVVTCGAGVALPFFALGRPLGARTIYFEVYDRINSATLTGRLCYPLSDLFLVQWEEQRVAYPRGKLVGKVF